MGKVREILKIGVPIMLGQACTVILSFADNIMIGWYGVNDLAAASFVNGLINLFIITEMGFANGMTPVIGSQFGVGDRTGIGRTLKNSIVLNGAVAIAGLLIMAAIYVFLKLSWDGADEISWSAVLSCTGRCGFPVYCFA